MKQTNWNFIFSIASLFLLGLAMWLIHDRFIPVQEGWMQYYSLMTQKGMVPYRDFYYFTQPIPLFIIQLVSKFGDGYILYRYYGMLERLILILILYCLIAKHFSPTATFIAVVTSAFVYQGFNIDILYTYYQTTLLFFFLSLICLQRRVESRYALIYDCFTGIFASLAFFTKQSSGLLVSVFFVFIMVWHVPGKLMFRRLPSFLIGWALPSFFILGWLITEHIFSDYLIQVFGGASSKGSILNILFGFWVRSSTFPYFVLFTSILLILYFFWKNKRIDIEIESQPDLQLSQSNWLLLFIFPLCLLGGFLIQPDKNISRAISGMGDLLFSFWVYFTFYVLTIATVLIGAKWLFRKQIPVSMPIAELALASFTWTYSVGLSGQLEAYATLLGTALTLAFLIDRIRPHLKFYKFFLVAVSCLVIFVSAAKKNQMYYDWWGWTEYGHSENVTSIIPAFKGFGLSSNTAEIYDRIYIDILKNTTLNDYVFTYPYMSLFNYVTGRMQPTFSPVHYFDVTPDYIATLDAEAIKNNPPKMIVYMEIPELEYKLHEEIYRQGQPSGQRNMDAAIKEIVNKYSYKKIDSFISPKWNWNIYVWLKP